MTFIARIKEIFRKNTAFSVVLAVLSSCTTIGAMPAVARVSSSAHLKAKTVGKARSKAPAGSVVALQKKAFAYYLQRNFVEATKLFKQCFALSPGDVSINFYLGAAALYAMT